MIERKAYRQPAVDLPGEKTLVHPDPVPESGEGNSALPSPPWSRSKPINHLHYEKPQGVNWRTPSKPGEDSERPIPEVRTTPVRRPDMNASEVEGAMNGPPYPAGPDRQKEQRGQARMYYKKWYQSHRGELKLRSKKWWKKNRNKFNYKKDQRRRREWPAKFERKPGGGIKVVKDRSREWREEHKGASEETDRFVFLPFSDWIPFLQGSTGREGHVIGFDLDTGTVLADFGLVWPIPLEEFFENAIFENEEDTDALFERLDGIFEWPGDPATRVAYRWAEMLYLKEPPDMDPDHRWDRGRDRSEGWTDGAPAEEEQGGFVNDNPGSAKVIPDNRDFVNNKAAARISDLQAGCDPGILERAKGIPFRKIRTDEKNLVWLFDVAGSEGKRHRVRVKVVIPKGNVRNVAKADILVSCSCPFWRWQGPEHWALERGYLYGRPKGSATSPDTRDPDGKNLICKHIAAILDRMSEWTIPSAMPKTATVTVVSWRDFVIREVVRRYGSRMEGTEHACL